MKKLFLIAPMIIVFLTGSFSFCTADEFELVRQNHDLSLYERWVPSKDGEEVRELKAVLIVRSDIQTIISLLRDGSKGIRWNRHAAAYRIAPVKNAGSWVTYIRYGMPWPFNDQDCCLQEQLTQPSPGSTLISFKSITDRRFPIKSTADRITGVRGAWLLEKLDETKTSVTYTITTDKSKKIPRWVSDPVIHNNLFSTMQAFKEIAEDNFKYSLSN